MCCQMNASPKEGFFLKKENNVKYLFSNPGIFVKNVEIPLGILQEIKDLRSCCDCGLASPSGDGAGRVQGNHFLCLP